MTGSPATAEVTVVNADSWLPATAQLAALLSKAANGTVIPDAMGHPADPNRVAVLRGLDYGSQNSMAMRDALSRLTGAPRTEQTVDGHAPGAAESAPTRLTLTVEEAAATLGISRAFAYEAVRRGEIPSIKIGRRVLVPRAALQKLLEPGEAPPALTTE